MRSLNALRHDRRTHGFTLIELLVVIAIVAILAAASLPIIGAVKDNANSARSIANLRQIGSALSAYAAENGSYPAIDGNSPLDGVDNWVAQLVVQLNPDDEIDELAETLPTDVFVSPGIVWQDTGGTGSFYAESEIINTYSATDCMVGLGIDFEEDTSRGRRPDSIDRKPESILIIEGKQEGSEPYCRAHISWGDASNDLGGTDVERTGAIDYRYRKRVNALMSDMSAVNLGKISQTGEIEKWNWKGTEYRDRR